MGFLNPMCFEISKKLKWGPFGENFEKKVSQCRKTERGDPVAFFNIHSVAKHQKIEGGQKFLYSEKNLTVPKKTERGDPLGFSNIHSDAKQQKIEGGPFGEKFFSQKKSRSAEKKLEGGPFGLARYGMLRGKTGKTFLVQFARPNGAIIFCRIFKNYFGQFVWIEKKSHYKSRVSLHEAPTKKLKGDHWEIQKKIPKKI